MLITLILRFGNEILKHIFFSFVSRKVFGDDCESQYVVAVLRMRMFIQLRRFVIKNPNSKKSHNDESSVFKLTKNYSNNTRKKINKKEFVGSQKYVR